MPGAIWMDEWHHVTSWLTSSRNYPNWSATVSIRERQFSINCSLFPHFLFDSRSSTISYYIPHYVERTWQWKPCKEERKGGRGEEADEGVSSRSRRLRTRQRLWAASTWILSSTKTPWQAGCAVRTGRGRGEGFDSRHEPLNQRTSSLRTATMQSGRFLLGNVFLTSTCHLHTVLHAETVYLLIFCAVFRLLLSFCCWFYHRVV